MPFACNIKKGERKKVQLIILRRYRPQGTKLIRLSPLSSRRVLRLPFPYASSHLLNLATACGSVVDGSHKGLACSYFTVEGRVPGADHTPLEPSQARPCPSACSSCEKRVETKEEKREKGRCWVNAAQTRLCASRFTVRTSGREVGSAFLRTSGSAVKLDVFISPPCIVPRLLILPLSVSSDINVCHRLPFFPLLSSTLRQVSPPFLYFIFFTVTLFFHLQCWKKKGVCGMM